MTSLRRPSNWRSCWRGRWHARVWKVTALCCTGPVTWPCASSTPLPASTDDSVLSLRSDVRAAGRGAVGNHRRSGGDGTRGRAAGHRRGRNGHRGTASGGLRVAGHRQASTRVACPTEAAGAVGSGGGGLSLAFYTSMRLAGVAVGTVVAIGSAPAAAAVIERFADRTPLTRRWAAGAATGGLGGARPGHGKPLRVAARGIGISDSDRRGPGDPGRHHLRPLLLGRCPNHADGAAQPAGDGSSVRARRAAASSGHRDHRRSRHRLARQHRRDGVPRRRPDVRRLSAVRPGAGQHCRQHSHHRFVSSSRPSPRSSPLLCWANNCRRWAGSGSGSCSSALL